MTLASLRIILTILLFVGLSPLAKEHHGGEERAAEESEASFSSPASLLLPDPREALLRPGLRQRRRGKSGTVTYVLLTVITSC